jgi:hypothetical protein
MYGFVFTTETFNSIMVISGKFSLVKCVFVTCFHTYNCLKMHSHIHYALKPPFYYCVGIMEIEYLMRETVS